MAQDSSDVRLSDLKVCGGWMGWEEFREMRRQNLIDGLREVFEPKRAGKSDAADAPDA